MQYPAANAHPFEFARIVLLMAALAFFAGFGGYMAIHPAPVTVARDTVQAPAAQTPPTVVSTPVVDTPELPQKT